MEETETPAATSTPSATPTPLVADAASLAPAQELLREGSYAEAADLFDAILRGANDDATRSAALRGGGIAHFEEGDRTRALDLLQQAFARAPRGSEEQARAVYLLGVRLNEAGEYKRALDVLNTSIAAPGPLAPYLRFEAARATAHHNPPDAAAVWDALLADATTPSSLVLDIYRERAEAAKRAGGQVERERWLRYVADDGDTAARMELAGSARVRGDLAAYATELRAVVAGAPSSAFALQAADALRGGGFAYNAGEVGLAYYRHRKYETAREILGAGIDEPGISPGAQAFRAFYYAAALEDDAMMEDAVAAYDRAATFDITNAYAHRARYWAARTTEALGDGPGASKRYVALTALGSSEFASEAAFRAGYTLFRAGDAAAAVAAWDQLGVAIAPRSLYWKARAYRALGDSAAATATFAAARDADPFDFFALQAAREIGSVGDADVRYRELGPVPAPDWAALEAALFPDTTAVWAPRTAAAEMVQVGLRSRGAVLILEAASGAQAYDLYALMREAHAASMPDIAARLSSRLRSNLGLAWPVAPKQLMQLAYPVTYVMLLDRHSRDYGIDPLFFAALIRQESFWDASAGSHAGALGLTQVIAPTGEAIARSLGVEFSPEDLFRPAVALRFGANYISGQLRALGNPYHALAAYNAGPGNAARWAAATGGLGPADFAEAVDFAETQGYVIAVMEHYAHYQAAYR